MMDGHSHVELVGLVEILPAPKCKAVVGSASLVCKLGNSVDLDAEFCRRHGILPKPDGIFSLMYQKKNFHVAYDEEPVVLVQGAFAKSLVTDVHGKWLWVLGESKTWFSSTTWHYDLCYLKLLLGEAHVWKVWQTRCYVRGAQHWLSVPDTWSYESMFKCEHTSRGICDVLRNLCAAGSGLSLSHDLLVKRSCRSGGNDASNRFLQSPTVSTTGFLLLLMLQAFGKQSTGEMVHRASRYKHLLDVFLSEWFQDKEIGLNFDPFGCTDDVAVCCSVPKSRRHTVVVENCAVELDDFVDREWVKKVLRLNKLPEDTSRMSLLDFLGAIFRLRRCWRPMASQLLVSLGMWADCFMPSRLGRDSLAAARHQAPDRMTYDPVLVDLVSMGAIDGTESSGATNVYQHARSFMNLRLVRRFDLNRSWASICRRYWLACREHTHGNGKLVLVHDGSRFTSDTLFSFVGSRKDGEFKAMIAPPQVTFENRPEPAHRTPQNFNAYGSSRLPLAPA